MAVRITRVSEAAEILRAAHLFDEPPTPAGAQAFLDAPGHHLLVAHAGDEPAGFVTGVELRHPDKEPELFVYELGVDAAHQRAGIAIELLTALGKHVAGLGIRTLWTGTEPDNSAAQATYRRVGATAEPTTMFTWPAP